MRLALLVAAVLAVDAIAQEEQVAAAATVRVRASGELSVFMPDGGCQCQPVSRVAVPPYPCNGTCNVQRARTRAALVDQLDGGAFNP